MCLVPGPYQERERDSFPASRDENDSRRPGLEPILDFGFWILNWEPGSAMNDPQDFGFAILDQYCPKKV